MFRKGIDPGVDSYSGFFDNGHAKATGLGDWLEHRTFATVEGGVVELWRWVEDGPSERIDGPMRRRITP